jgi:hypothetical protein
MQNNAPERIKEPSCYGLDMWCALYSIQQGCFHVEQLRDYLEANTYAYNGIGQLQYFMVGGLFESIEDVHYFIKYFKTMRGDKTEQHQKQAQDRLRSKE